MLERQLWDEEKLNIIRPLTRSSCRITFWCLRGIVLFYPSVTSSVKRKTMWLLNVTCNVSVSTLSPVPPQEGSSGKLPPSLVSRVSRLHCSRARVQVLPSLTLKKKRDCSHAVYRLPETVVGASLKLCSLRTGPFPLSPSCFLFAPSHFLP